MLNFKRNPLFQSVNETLDLFGAPIKLVDGYIGEITAQIPWATLFKVRSESDQNCLRKETIKALLMIDHDNY